MQIYKYQAISKGGEKVSGVIDGFNEFDAVERIKKTCDVILTISQVKEDAPGLLNMEIGGNKLNTKAFTVMCSQFAIILRSGIPIARTIHLIADKTTDKKIKHILKQVGEDVEAGHSVYASFKERGEKLFPQIFLETIRAGEESGSLDKAFETMYLHYDKQVKLKNKVKGALAYPAFVLFVAIVVVIVLMVAVVPTFTAIFESYGAQLPLITQALIAISDFFRDYWLVLAIIAIALVIVYKFVSANEDGRLWLAKTSLKLPVFGNINILTAASEFANSMTTMLGAGLPITRSLSISAKVISNYYISQEIGKLSGKIEEGQTLGASLREANVMPDILVDMTAVGEETGEMEETLHTIAGYYDAELEVAINAALSKLEPAILVFLGGVAGFIVLAVYIAMFEMYNVM